MYFHREFSEWNLGGGSHPFLMILWHHDGLTQTDLTDMLHMDKAGTARTLSRLTELGYVEKRTDETDHRAHRIFLTNKGRELTGR